MDQYSMRPRGRARHHGQSQTPQSGQTAPRPLHPGSQPVQQRTIGPRPQMPRPRMTSTQISNPDNNCPEIAQQVKINII